MKNVAFQVLVVVLVDVLDKTRYLMISCAVDDFELSLGMTLSFVCYVSLSIAFASPGNIHNRLDRGQSTIGAWVRPQHSENPETTQPTEYGCYPDVDTLIIQCVEVFAKIQGTSDVDVANLNQRTTSTGSALAAF